MKKSEFLRFRIDIATHQLLMKHCAETGASVSQTLRKLLIRELVQHPAGIVSDVVKQPQPPAAPVAASGHGADAQVLASLLLYDKAPRSNVSERDFEDERFGEMVQLLNQLLEILASRRRARSETDRSPTREADKV